jgi:lipid A 4'-phosphatase
MIIKNKNKILDFVIPISVLGFATVLFHIFYWDIEIQSFFYSENLGWFLKNDQPWKFLYQSSNVPALLISVSSLILLGVSFFKTTLLKYRKILLFLTCVMAIGPGLVVNTILKDNWGRPRPRNVVEFGGNYQYEKPLEIDSSSKGKSFPCGHASMGFYLMSFFFIFRQNKKKLAYIFLLIGIISGCLIGMARIVQGGHFASDVIWAGGIVYLVAVSAYYLLKMDKTIFLISEIQLPVKRNLIVLIIFLTAISLALLIISSTPYHYEKQYIIDQNQQNYKMQLQFERGDVEFIIGDTPEIELKAIAHGFPWSKLKTKFKLIDNSITIKQRESGHFSEVNQTITITIPDTLKFEISIIIEEGNVILSEFSNNINLETDLQKGKVIR